MMLHTVLALAVAFATQALAFPAGSLPVPSSVGGAAPTPTPPPSANSGGSQQAPHSSVPPTTGICAPVANAVPLHRAYVGGATSAADHFYATSPEEMSKAVSLHDYKLEARAGRVYNWQEAGTIPLYRLFSESTSDHYYTTSADERDTATNVYGYQDEGIAAYIYQGQDCGSVPLFMLYSASATDHFYTTSEAEANASGYSMERIIGYILPA